MAMKICSGCGTWQRGKRCRYCGSLCGVEQSIGDTLTRKVRRAVERMREEWLATWREAKTGRREA